MYWAAKSKKEIRDAVFDAIAKNHNYENEPMLGLPGSFLDREVFPSDKELSQYPLLACFRNNPNHIGCHTFGTSEPSFQGTQDLERDLLQICAEQLLSAEPDTYDGYVASGGTESNIQAMWAFRNYFLKSLGVLTTNIGVLCSTDTHYSIAKGADLLGITLYQVEVDNENRAMDPALVRQTIHIARNSGITCWIVVLNMGTTMFGSVDSGNILLNVFDEADVSYKAHVDAAFGGFIYPMTSATNELSFADPRIVSITLDAHKMLQAPYGTGIHLIRKGYIDAVCTDSAKYVPGLDCTLVGSRSGTNAVAVWMILRAYGSEGGAAFCKTILERTNHLCANLDEIGIKYFRHRDMNVVAMHSDKIPRELIERYQLVPECHDESSQWVKIVVMDHVTDDRINQFMKDLREVR